MGTRRHFAAFGRAPAAGFGTLATMIHVRCVFFALGRAGFAQVGAELANISRVGTAAGHKRNGRVTQPGAIPVEPDAIHHHLDILLTEAGFGAGIAGNGARLAGVEALLILLGH